MFNLLFIFGTIIRFFLIGVSGFKADIAFWKGWGLAVADNGIIWLVKNTNYNYPPGFAYVLDLINKIYKLFADPYNISQYWMDTNLLYLFLFKLLIIASDIGIVFLIIKISNKFKFEWGKLLALIYFLNPAVIFDGVIWGQVDQFGLFLFLGAVYLFIDEKPKLASIIFTISWLMKWQNIIFIPIFYLFVYKKYSFEDLIKSLTVSLITFLIISLPFWLNREMASLINLFTVNSNWFPWYSLNAFNGWWITSGLNGMGIVDKTLVLGVINAKQFGLLLFCVFYFIASLNIYLAKKEATLKQFILSSTLIVFSFFHLLTQSHERYLFHLLGLIPLLMIINSTSCHPRENGDPGALDSRLRGNDNKSYWNNGLILWILISLGLFFNMYISMFYNYPDQVFWPFSAGITRDISLLISVFQIATFAYFFVKYFHSFIKANYLWFIGIILVFFSSIFIINYGYILGKPVSLTKITPVDIQQDYLKPMINMTVESARGVSYWNRLSNNYYFYNLGIGAHANSVISYSLGKRFSKLTTDFGIDTEGGEKNKASFIIMGDGRELYRSKPKGKYDQPESITVSISNIDKLSLIIKTEGTDNNGLHADWLNPVLIR